MSSFFERPKPAPPAPADRSIFSPVQLGSTRGGPLIDRRPKAPPPEPERDEVLEDMVPVGKLIDVKQPGTAKSLGYFDSRGFWVTRKAGGWQVQRGAPRAVLSLLDEQGRRTLAAAQQKARKKGLR